MLVKNQLCGTMTAEDRVMKLLNFGSSGWCHAAEGEGFCEAGRESRRFFCVGACGNCCGDSIAPHAQWLESSVSHVEQINGTTLDSMKNISQWGMLKTLQISCHSAPCQRCCRR